MVGVPGRGASPHRARGAGALGLEEEPPEVWAVGRTVQGFQMLSTISALPEAEVWQVGVPVRAQVDGAGRPWGEKGGKGAGPVNFFTSPLPRQFMSFWNEIIGRWQVLARRIFEHACPGRVIASIPFFH